MKILFTTPHFNEWRHIAFAYSLVKTRWPKGSSVNVVSCVGNSCAKANRMFVEVDWDVPIRHHAGGLLSYKGELVPQI